MSQQIFVEIEIPDSLDQFTLPTGVNDRLTELLDRQDCGASLTQNERLEAEGLVELAEFLSLLKLKSRRVPRKKENL